MKIIEHKKVIDFLKKKNIIDQYIKSKIFIESGYLKNADFKIRQPKKDGIYYFKINNQYRALCVFYNQDIVKVYDIDSHS